MLRRSLSVVNPVYLGPQLRQSLLHATSTCDRRLVHNAASTTNNTRWNRAVVPNRALLSVTGSHASTFLNGLTTVQIPEPTSDVWRRNGKVVYSAFLSAQGRIMYDVLIYPHVASSSSIGSDSGYIIEYDPRAADPNPNLSSSSAALTPSSPSAKHSNPPLISMLKRYILRSRVRVKDVSDHWRLCAIWPNNAQHDDQGLWLQSRPESWRWGRSGAVEPVYAAVESGMASSLPPPPDTSEVMQRCFSDDDVPDAGKMEGWLWAVDRRAPTMGLRVLVPTDHFNSVVRPHLNASPDEYTLHRIKLGVAEGKDDMPPQDSFPMDANMDMMGGADFRKGCYVGQELTVRTYHTGVIRKRTIPVELVPSSESDADHPRATSRPSPVFSPHLPIQADWPLPISEGKGTTSPRPRGSGKLLSSVGTHALALVRLEHLEGVENGKMVLKVTHGERKWDVVPRRPDWWPTHVPDDAGGSGEQG